MASMIWSRSTLWPPLTLQIKAHLPSWAMALPHALLSSSLFLRLYLAVIQLSNLEICYFLKVAFDSIHNLDCFLHSLQRIYRNLNICKIW